MKIAMVSRGDASSGGAGRMAQLLARELVKRGHQVTHFIRRKGRPDLSGLTSLVPGLPGDGLLRNAVGIDLSGLGLIARSSFWKSDVVHFHDLAVAYGALVGWLVSKAKPTVLSLHDFSTITGGCLNPGPCQRYLDGCGRCPQLGKWPLQLPFDRTSFHFGLHRRLSRSRRILAVTPSRYLADEAARGAWSGWRLATIWNAVDTEVFTPETREGGRRRLHLEPGSKVLLFVAGEVLAPHKGFLDIERSYCWLAEKDPSIHLVIVGRLVELPVPLQPYSSRIHRLGFIRDETELASIYAAADCLAVPTYGDTFNLTALEALSCGTSVVAYPTGGIPEFLPQIPCAHVLAQKDWMHLARQVHEVLQNLPGEATRVAGRNTVIRNHGLERFVSQYEAVYQSLLAPP